MKITTKIKRGIFAPIIYRLARSLGGYKRISNRIILNYHGVTNDFSNRINNRHLSAKQFEQDLKFYAKYFDVLSLQDMWLQAPAPSGQKKPQLAITFDDGFENNLQVAVPLLEKYHLPATIFVLSQPIHEADFINWTDLIDVLKVVYEGDRLNFMGQEFRRNAHQEFMLPEKNQTLSDFIKSKSKERIDPLRELAHTYLSQNRAVAAYEDQFKLMTAAQLQSCARSPLIEIGSHSRFHFNLGRVTPDLAREELRESKESLEALLQKPVTSFAYPDGDYVSLTKDLAESVGYSRQLAVSFHLPEDPQDSRIRRRFSYSNSTTHSSNMVRLLAAWEKHSF